MNMTSPTGHVKVLKKCLKRSGSFLIWSLVNSQPVKVFQHSFFNQAETDQLIYFQNLIKMFLQSEKIGYKRFKTFIDICTRHKNSDIKVLVSKTKYTDPHKTKGKN